jgi:26S proteasome regulatory subunit N4
MNQIEKAVEAQFAALASGEAEPEASFLPARPATNRPTMNNEVSTPFASVDQVTPSSPASLAGLQVGDKLVEFGEANWLNHDGMRKVAEVVQRNENVGVQIQTFQANCGSVQSGC